MSWYSKLLAQHPYIVLVVLSIFSGVCIIISFTSVELPSFHDPTLGFETRGTSISQRLTAWHNLLESTRPSGPLTLNTADLPPPSTPSPLKVKTNNKKKYKKSEKPDIYVTQSPSEDAAPTASKFEEASDLDAHKNWTFGVNVSKAHPNNNTSSPWQILKNNINKANNQVHDHDHLSADRFFCGSPGPDHSRMVLTSTDGSDLLSLKAIHSACALDLSVRQTPNFSTKCLSPNLEGGICCQSWALHNYIAAYFGHSDCSQIKEENIEDFRRLLVKCAQYYHNAQLPPDCQGNVHDPSEMCFKLPAECFKHNAVYNTMHYIVDAGFMPLNETKVSLVSQSMLFLPMAKSSAALAFYKSLNSKDLTVKNVKVSAMDFGVKSQLFDDCLVQDTWLISLGALCVFLCMWFYTGSFLVTCMTLIAVTLSLGLSYFFYTLIFGIEFFPFMNLLACVVAVGIGADDAFIFCKMWESIKNEKRQVSITHLTQESFSHAFVSMCVTSLTTAVAFFASCISPITAIRCFSIFAGLAVMANFSLMITWLPAVVILSEKTQCRIGNCPSGNFYLSAFQAHVEHFSIFFDKTLLFLVNSLPYLWIIILGLIACASAVLVLWWPGLHLPNSPDLQLFDPSHPFEQYDLVYRDKFRFEMSEQHAAASMPLRFVWGVKPVDNGNYMDPYSRGKLEMDSSFDMGANDSQIWLKNFCRLLRKQSFYQSTPGPLLQNCFIETLETWMKQHCKDAGSGKNLRPCCEVSSFPYKREVLRNCTARAMESIYRSPIDHNFAGPRFSKNITRPKIRAIVVEYDSNYSFSMSHQEMHSFYSQVEEWLQEQLNDAPVGLRHGWFVSDLQFYDLQHTISGSTIMAIMVSMGLSLVVLLLVTLNVLVSLFAILCVASTVFVTVAILVLLGWQLNVLESVAICTAIGLAVDFSLHYSVSYRLAPDNTNREEAVKFSLKRMAGPTAMAAITTAIAGLFMLPSTVMAYIQIGKFLIILMAVSWIYATFLLLPLLRVAGPRHGFCQLSYQGIFCGICKFWQHKSSDGAVIEPEKTIFDNILSESTLSASSTRHALHPSTSETHELEALSHSARRGFGRKHRSESLRSLRNAQKTTSDQSPSATSANTVIFCNDGDIDRQCT